MFCLQSRYWEGEQIHSMPVLWQRRLLNFQVSLTFSWVFVLNFEYWLCQGILLLNKVISAERLYDLIMIMYSLKTLRSLDIVNDFPSEFVRLHLLVEFYCNWWQIFIHWCIFYMQYFIFQDTFAHVFPVFYLLRKFVGLSSISR